MKLNMHFMFIRIMDFILITLNVTGIFGGYAMNTFTVPNQSTSRQTFVNDLQNRNICLSINMGKNKKPDTFDYFYSDGKLGKAFDRYGVEGASFGGRPGEGHPVRMPEDVDRDLAKAAMNDYDTRRTMEAMALSGKAKAEKYAKKGFKNATDVIKANNMFERWHDKNGNGGDFSSNSDYAGLTYDSVKRDRAKQMETIKDEYASISALENLRDALEARNAAADPVEAPELSQTLVQAQQDVDDYSLSLGTLGDNLFGRTDSDDLQTASAENEYNPAAGESQDFKNDYLSNVKDGLRISGISTRGPGSGIYGGGF